MNSPVVTVIIPTTAEAKREMQIKRCIDSIRASSVDPVQILMVVNGARYDEAVCRWVKAQPDIQFEYVDMPSAPNAVLCGRRLVQTPYFTTLDDDDEFVALATDVKLQVLENDCEADLVVTNTTHIRGDQVATWYSRLSEVPADPLTSMFFQTWLNSGNALYRTSSIGVEYFEDWKPFAEWTWLAYKLAIAGKKVSVIDTGLNIINVTSGSLSQSTAYEKSYLTLFESMLNAGPPPHVATMIKWKISAYWHDRAERLLREQRRTRALMCHLRSLLQPGGLKYVSFSRHFLRAKFEG